MEATTATVLGTTGDVDTCDCCGRSGLLRTVAIRLDGGEVEHFGTTCAARYTGTTAKAITDAARTADQELARQAEAARAATAATAQLGWSAWVAQQSGLEFGPDALAALGGFAAARAAFNAR